MERRQKLIYRDISRFFLSLLAVNLYQCQWLQTNLESTNFNIVQMAESADTQECKIMFLSILDS